MACDYKWRKVHAPHASDHGTVTAEPSEVTFTSDLDFGVLSNGTATVSESGTATTIGEFTIHFDGKVAWLYVGDRSRIGGCIQSTSATNAFKRRVPLCEMSLRRRRCFRWSVHVFTPGQIPLSTLVFVRLCRTPHTHLSLIHI